MKQSKKWSFTIRKENPKQPPNVAVYSKNREGHRGSYIEFICRLLDAKQCSLTSVYSHKGPAFFLLIEDSPIHYILACFWRSLFAKPTFGLLFLPKQALDGTSLRHRAKRTILKLLKRFRHVTTMTILPHNIDQRFSSISDDWIYDFQFWDLESPEYTDYARLRLMECESYIVDKLRGSARGRRVVSAVGVQHEKKGFDVFARSFCSSNDLRASFLFAFGGQVIGSARDYAKKLESAGGVAIDQFLSDDELLSLYAASDVIWCHYPPVRDQSSGVFGRAIQLGLPVLVRTGSLIHRFCVSENIPHVARDSGDSLNLTEADVPSVDMEQAKNRVDKFRQITIERLQRALGTQFIRPVVQTVDAACSRRE